jgi:hypothetical protein
MIIIHLALYDDILITPEIPSLVNLPQIEDNSCNYFPERNIEWTEWSRVFANLSYREIYGEEADHCSEAVKYPK